MKRFFQADQCSVNRNGTVRGGSSPKIDVRTLSARRESEREVGGGPGVEPPEKFYMTTPFRLSDNAPFPKMSRERPIG